MSKSFFAAFDQPETYPYWIVIPLFVMVGILMIGFGFVCFLLCEYPHSQSKYQQQISCFGIRLVETESFLDAKSYEFADNRYQESAVGFLRRKMLSGPDLQLNRLRVASDNMITEYNPNYEFGGVVYTIKDLKDIPRDQLQLQKYYLLNRPNSSCICRFLERWVKELLARSTKASTGSVLATPWRCPWR